MMLKQKIKLPDDQIYLLLCAKRAVGLLNLPNDLVDIKLNNGRILFNRRVEGAQFLIIEEKEKFQKSEIAEIILLLQTIN